MAHFLDGDWNVYIISGAIGGGVATVSTRTSMHLKHTATNDLDVANSRHNGHELSGSSRPIGRGFEISFSEKIPAGPVFEFRHYTGHFMESAPRSDGRTDKVIGGFRGRLRPTPPEVERDKAKELLGQNDGIWIATQP